MKVLEQLSRGGFGRVEKVLTDEGQIVARKIFEPHIEGLTTKEIEKLKQRFIREVKIQSSLSGDFFIPILGYQLETEPYWFTMPLAEKNFLDEIASCHISSDIPVSGFSDILNALEELHNLGYVHRDLKPQNILYHDGRWKLADFGLVLPLTSSTTKLTSYSSAWGTALYCAPDQIEDFRNSTIKVDIYAFGCVLHDLFVNAQRVPYQQYTAPGAIGIIIEKCTDVEPKKRFKNITQVRGSLLSVLAEPQRLNPSSGATEWINNLLEFETWDVSHLDSFARFMRRAELDSDVWVICEALDEDKIRKLDEIDGELWSIVAAKYCEWAQLNGFPFEYCDVIIRRLEIIFELGDISTKALAALASAALGAHHNRWFVMRQVVKLCGKKLDNPIAQRIAIEIDIAEVQRFFYICADHISLLVDVYHPHIASVLKEWVEKNIPPVELSGNSDVFEF
jgi:serine/threonine protein kinase